MTPAPTNPPASHQNARIQLRAHVKETGYKSMVESYSHKYTAACVMTHIGHTARQYRSTLTGGNNISLSLGEFICRQVEFLACLLNFKFTTIVTKIESGT